MKSGKNKSKQSSITQPLIQELIDQDRLNRSQHDATTTPMPLEPPSLYQDAGGGYNSNFTFPQE